MFGPPPPTSGPGFSTVDDAPVGHHRRLKMVVADAIVGPDGPSGEVGPAWCTRARSTVGPGCPEAPSTVAPSGEAHADQTLRASDTPSAVTNGGRGDGRGLCAVLWAGCAQARGGGVSGHAGAGRGADQGGPGL